MTAGHPAIAGCGHAAAFIAEPDTFWFLVIFTLD
jgi:hypothetical protein